ncbi:hypothetical protein DE146DRAFT_372609 [Phaeosphaeria sp. MPI-PUGE-AT-0046c]|nr:hypothetical protein DE146DRAFT_372609 [Phaeosphaeria sp. MPI-PUGE-AT-0046c]
MTSQWSESVKKDPEMCSKLYLVDRPVDLWRRQRAGGRRLPAHPPRPCYPSTASNSILGLVLLLLSLTTLIPPRLSFRALHQLVDTQRNRTQGVVTENTPTVGVEPQSEASATLHPGNKCLGSAVSAGRQPTDSDAAVLGLRIQPYNPPPLTVSYLVVLITCLVLSSGLVAIRKSGRGMKNQKTIIGDLS